jgi:WD40 repeat protein
MSLFTPIRVLRALPSALHSVWFVDPGRLLVSAQYWSPKLDDVYGAARLITEEGRCLGQTQGRHSTAYTAVHPSGQQYACTSSGGCTVHDLRSADLPLARRLRHRGQAMERLLYTPNGRWLVGGGGGEANPLVLWDTADWTPCPLGEFAQPVRSLGIDSGTRALLVGGWRGGIQLRDLGTWEVTDHWQSTQQLQNRYPGVNALQLSPDGRTLYAAFGHPPYLRSFRLPGFSPGQSFEQEYEVHALVLLGDGTLVSGDEHGDVTFWDGERPTVRDRYNADGRRQLVVDVARGRSQEEETSGGLVSALAVSPDGRRLAVGDGIGDDEGRVHLLDLNL